MIGITHIYSRQFFIWLLQASKRNNWKPKAVHHGDPGLRVTIQLVGAQVVYCIVDQRKQTRKGSWFLDPKVLKKEGKPFSWWRWWMMLLRMSRRGCVGTDTCKTHIIYFTVAYLLLFWIFNQKCFSWQDVWTKNTWNKTWQEVLWISFWQKHKLQHLQWRVSILVYPQCTKNS